jgi:hypothetical protein
MGSMILKWFLVRGVLLQTSAFLPVPFDSMEEVVLAKYLVRLGGVLLHGPIWCVWVVVGIFPC